MRFNFKRIFFFKKHWVRYRAKRSSSTLFDLKSSESSKMSPNHTKPHHPPIIIIIIIIITITITITIIILSLPDFNSILLTVVAITIIIIIILIELPPFSSMIFPAVNTSVFFSGISQLAMFDYPGLITITIVSSPEYSTPHICFQLLYICGNSLLHHGVSGCSRIWERMGRKGFIMIYPLFDPIIYPFIQWICLREHLQESPIKFMGTSSFFPIFPWTNPLIHRWWSTK